VPSCTVWSTSCPRLLCDVAGYDASLKKWLLDGEQYSELLPARLQSRWIDARQLPSSEHADALVDAPWPLKCGSSRGSSTLCPKSWCRPPSCGRDAWKPRGRVMAYACWSVAARASSRAMPRGGPCPTAAACTTVMSVAGCCAWCGMPISSRRRGTVARMCRTRSLRYAALGRPLLLETHRSNFTALNLAVEQAFVELEQAIARLRWHASDAALSSRQRSWARQSGSVIPRCWITRSAAGFSIWIRRVAQQSACWVARCSSSRGMSAAMSAASRTGCYP
jgi:hypothetical protein